MGENGFVSSREVLAHHFDIVLGIVIRPVGWLILHLLNWMICLFVFSFTRHATGMKFGIHSDWSIWVIYFQLVASSCGLSATYGQICMSTA